MVQVLYLSSRKISLPWTTGSKNRYNYGFLNEGEPNINRAIQTVGDIFAITTKNLDQLTRAGAFRNLLEE